MNQLTAFIVKRCRVATLSAGLVFCVGAPNSFAQERDTSGSDQGEAQITLKLEDTDIRDLINLVAEVSGKNFIVDPRVKGKVSVISGATLSPDHFIMCFFLF